MTNYPPGVSDHSLPEWEGKPIDDCRDDIAGTQFCRERCLPDQVIACIEDRHRDRDCVDDCPICEDERVGAEYNGEGER